MGTLYKVAEGGAYRGHVGLRIILIDQLRSAKHDRTRNQLPRKVLTTGFPCVSAQAGPLTVGTHHSNVTLTTYEGLSKKKLLVYILGL